MTDTTMRFGGIPAVIRYIMPGRDSLPDNTVDWRPDASRAALLIHDMQRYFLRPLASAPSPYGQLVGNIALLRSRCARAGVPVAYTAQPGGMTQEQRGLLRHFWGAGMSTDPADREIIPDLAPRKVDRVFTKWRYSAFFATDLADWMCRLGRTQLIICGVYAHVGVLMTACDAYSRDIQPFIVADAIADFTRTEHELTLRYAAARCAVVATAGEIAEKVHCAGTAISSKDL